MSRLRSSWLSFACCILVCVAGKAAAQNGERASDPAHATADGDDAVGQARQLFGEGLAFVEAEDWIQAEERFRRVLALKSSHVVAYNLASALVHLGRLTESSELLRVVLRDAAADASTHEAAQQLLSEIEPLIGSITLRISGETSGASLSVDDRALDLSALVQTVSVDPGTHHITVQRDAGLLVDRRVSVGGQAPLQAEVALDLPPRVSPEAVADQAARDNPTPIVRKPAHDEPAPEHGSGSVLTKWWLWAGVGAAVATTVAVILLVPSSEQAKPVAGDTNPPYVRGTVR